MALLSIVATGVSVWAVWLVRNTLEHTRLATKAAVKSAAIAENAFVTLERPYLFLNSAFFEKGTPPIERVSRDNQETVFPVVSLPVKNFGRSPAIVAELKARLWLGTLADLPASPRYDDENITIKRSGVFSAVLAPNDELTMRNAVPLTRTNETWARVQNDFYRPFQEGEGFSLVLFGYIDYASVSGMKERIGFCKWYDLERSRFIEQDVPEYSYRKRIN